MTSAATVAAVTPSPNAIRMDSLIIGAAATYGSAGRPSFRASAITFLAMLCARCTSESNERNAYIRARPRPRRSHLPEHDFHGRHRPVRRDSLRRPGDAWAAMPDRVGRRRAARALRRLHLGRTRRRDARRGRQLRFSARSLRSRALGPPDVVPIHLADALPGPAQRCFGLARI